MNYRLGALDPDFAPEKSCMNLPDAWVNMTIFYEGDTQGEAVIITKWFAWTHGVQRDYSIGYLLGQLLVPSTPKYPEDGREPGFEMYELSKKKMDKSASLGTAFGFIGHNAMDRNVHYDYFQGASDDHANNWLLHKPKETWADYLAFYYKSNGTFNGSNGAVDSMFGRKIEPTQVFIKCTGDAELIQIAQKAYIKNRRSTNVNIKDYLDNYQTVPTISDIVSTLQSDIDTVLKKMNHNEFVNLQEKAFDKHWDQDEAISLYIAAVENAKKRLTKAKTQGNN